MKIPFSSLPVSPDSAIPSRIELKRPIVALLLERGNIRVIVYAVVDSGADVCVFPASVARDLGINIGNQGTSSFSGSGDATQMAWFAEIQATILPMEAPNIEPNQAPLTFPLYAGFCDTMERIGMGLLGQEGLSSRFTVNFHHAQNYFEIQSPDHP